MIFSYLKLCSLTSTYCFDIELFRIYIFNEGWFIDFLHTAHTITTYNYARVQWALWEAIVSILPTIWMLRVISEFFVWALLYALTVQRIHNSLHLL